MFQCAFVKLSSYMLEMLLSMYCMVKLDECE